MKTVFLDCGLWCEFLRVYCCEPVADHEDDDRPAMFSLRPVRAATPRVIA